MEVSKCIDQKRVQSYAWLLRSHGSSKDLESGRATHAEMINTGYSRDRFLANLLIEMYGKCSSLGRAREVFDSIDRKNVFSWTMLIVAHTHNQLHSEAIALFRSMECEGAKPDEFTLASLLDACASLGDLQLGKSIHERVRHLGLECNVFLQTALIKMYGRCCRVTVAAEIFDQIDHPSVISSTAMIAAFAQNGKVSNASDLFESMLAQGLNPDLVAWTAMITAFAQEDSRGREAIQLFRRMDLEGLKPDRFTFVGALDACSVIPSLEEGKKIHARLVYSLIECDGVVGNALVNFYAKTGQLNACGLVFESMKVKNVVTWSSIIAAFAKSGDHTRAVCLFREMQLQGVAPNRVTFVSLLFSCSHSGLVDESIYWLFSMSPDYHVDPLEQHCVCVIDILGRVGKLEEAEKLLRKNAAGFFNPEVVHLVSTSLLGFCKVQGELYRGAGIAERVLELDAECGPSYVSVSNILATTGKPENQKSRSDAHEVYRTQSLRSPV